VHRRESYLNAQPVPDLSARVGHTECLLLNAESSGKLRHVTLRFIRRNSARLRVFTAALLLCAVAFAVGLSTAAQLHRSLHKMSDRANHQCAATLISSGSVEHSAGAPSATEPRHGPIASVFRPQCFSRVLASLAFSLLEHAPPAQS